MKQAGGIIAVLVLVAIGIYVYMNWRKWFPSVASQYDDCVNKNKALPEGSGCTNCIPDGSEIPTFTGTIVSGVCTQVQPPPPPPVTVNTIKVSNQAGARVHTYYGGQNQNIFVPQNKWIPFGTETTYTKTISTAAATYYNTPFGWLPASDLTILTTN